MKLQILIEPEKLAYWYFRLNGFLTIVNFVVHPDRGHKQETDVDILGARFPYRAELLENPMEDKEIFSAIKNKPYIVIAEVKTGTCKLNGPWIKQKRKNMHRVLSAVGVFPKEFLEEIAARIYEEGVFENEFAYLTLFCIGSQINRNLNRRYSKVPQVTWTDILEFIYNRFNKYRIQKAAHPQWDRTGHKLWKCALGSKNKEDFIKNIKVDTQHKRQSSQA